MVGFFYPYGQFQDEHHETQIFGRFEMPKLMAERLKSCWISKNQVLRGAGMVSMHWAFQKCLGAQVAFTAWKGGTKQIPHLLEMVLLVVCSLRKIYMDVSENWGTPKSSILIGFSIINHPFWGTPFFGNTYMGCSPQFRV